jgi:secondary thiamine-phosphate synthase enzyme
MLLMNIILHTTKHKEVVDITDTVEREVVKSGWGDGAVLVFVAHTTCALTTADLDPGTDEDLLDAVAAMFPQGDYRHPHDPSHVGEHIMSSLIGPSVTVPIESGKLVLGTWQRVVLVELSGPRNRTIVLKHIATSE